MLTFVHSSLIISHLQSLYSNEDIAIAYFYCNHQNEMDQSAEKIIASLAKQLANRKSNVPQSLAQLYQTCLKDTSFSPTLEHYLTLLQSLTASFTRVIILVDALDECASEKNRRFIISSLQRLHTIKVFITSRVPGCQDITDMFTKDKVQRLDIQATKSDLERYVRMELEENHRKLDFIPFDLKENIVSTIAGNADGR
jgi:Cdc6-like AAA superfamily ATPase